MDTTAQWRFDGGGEDTDFTERIRNETGRDSVLECASPLALSTREPRCGTKRRVFSHPVPSESGRGLPHSRTCGLPRPKIFCNAGRKRLLGIFKKGLHSMPTTMNPGRPCPRCGKPTANGELADLCPACLLAQGLETDTGAARPRFEPPPIDRIARLFPQLDSLRLLGAGGMGAVYQARQPALDRWVALKVVPAATGPETAFQERFNREARALARLNHPNIVTVHEFGQVEDLHYFIMEFVEGTNLRQLEKAGRLSPREALQIIPQICDALQYAHDEGVVHRDIKPENLLIDRKGRVKIADFGLAKILDPQADSTAARLTIEGQVMGTPHYMAPEQLERPLAVDHRADIYSLGVVLYEMLTGDLPLGKFAPPSRKVAMDVRLDEVVLRALENDPARRYQHVGEVKTRLESISETPASAESTPPTKPTIEYLRFAGFPVIAERDGTRTVHRFGVARAFALLFGILTVFFGVGTLFLGGHEAGWFGIVGWQSVVLRIVMATIVVALGVRAAQARKLERQTVSAVPAPVPQSEGISGKAIMGAAWLALGLAALLLWSIPFMHSVEPLRDGGGEAGAGLARRWKEGVLILVALPGLFAPIGTTLLGWLAVHDIRRSRGRIGGLKLALFDGLIAPLLLLNSVFLFFLRGGLALPARLGWQSSSDLTSNLALGVVLILILNWILLRAIWNRVRLDSSPSREPWWCGGPVVAALAVACVMLIQVVAQLRATRAEAFGRFVKAADQIATADPETGALVAALPDGSKLELLAVETPQNPNHPWSLPDGTALAKSQYSIAESGPNPAPNPLDTRLIFRLRNSLNVLQSIGFSINSRDEFGAGEFTTSCFANVGVLKSGQPVNGAFYLFKAPHPGGLRNTFRLAVDLDPWRVVAIAGVDGEERIGESRTQVPGGFVHFQPSGEYKGQTRVTTLAYFPTNDLQISIHAIGTNGTIYLPIHGSGSFPANGPTTLFSEFSVPIREIREFQALVRRHYWIEFPNVVNSSRNVAGSERTTPQFAPEVEIGFSGVLDLDTAKAGDLPPDPNQGVAPFRGVAAAALFMQAHGFDLMHGAGHLDAIGVTVVTLFPMEWDALSPGELRTRLERDGAMNESITPVTFPTAYGFRTREGTFGMLRIVRIDADQSIVRIKRVAQ